jgi:hypothetical protein
MEAGVALWQPAQPKLEKRLRKPPRLPPDGSFPNGGLVLDGNGILYGVTTAGGPFGSSIGGYGTVYVLTPPTGGKGAWIEKILYGFTGVANSDGAFPQGGLIVDASGALYGTTSQGGIATSNDQEGNAPCTS